jgi:hypothetical protein
MAVCMRLSRWACKAIWPLNILDIIRPFNRLCSQNRNIFRSCLLDRLVIQFSSSSFSVIVNGESNLTSLLCRCHGSARNLEGSVEVERKGTVS